MKQTATIISTYAADISGICSAMYELGGMTVMHDASGCNSTYNTHDEPRWYDMDSLVFISGLSETEAILGDDDKLIRDTVAAAKELKPRFITLGGTPIPMMTGTDFPAVAYQIERETGIPTFGLNTDGMHSYIAGASKAFAVLAKRICKDNVPKTEKLSVNILGATPLDFSINGTIQAMKRALEAQGIEVYAIWAMSDEKRSEISDLQKCAINKSEDYEETSTVEISGVTSDQSAKVPEAEQLTKASAADLLFRQIETAAAAHVNLVISACGLKAAKILWQRFQIPYVIGTPCGAKFTKKVVDGIKVAAKSGENKNLLMDYPEAKTVIIGESVTALSLANALYEETGNGAKVLCAVDTERELFSKGCIEARDEVELIPHLQKAEIIIADPMYRPICPKEARFFELPHEGFSGRIYRNQIPQLIDGLDEFIEKIYSCLY